MNVKQLKELIEHLPDNTDIRRVIQPGGNESEATKLVTSATVSYNSDGGKIVLK